MIFAHQVRVHVVRRATEERELFISVTFCGESKINYLYTIAAIHQDVVELEVTMNHATAVHVVDGRENLREDSPTLGLFHASNCLLLRFLDRVIETFAFAKLHNEMHMRARVNHFVQLTDVLMVNHGENEDLSVKRI